MIPLPPSLLLASSPEAGAISCFDVALSFYPQPDHARPLMQLQAAGVASEEQGEIVALNTTWLRHRASLGNLDACRHHAGWELAQPSPPSTPP